MYIYDILHKEKVYQCVATDLRSLGVKYRLKKNAVKTEKVERSANLSRKLFRTPLSHLPLDVVNLSSGAIVHVPAFVSEVVAFLQPHLTQEGLFRKAGSQLRQRELISKVDNGGSLGDKYNAVDVANCLKTFFRQLPEPLIPFAYHDLLLRCGLLKTDKIEALLLACLLLPPHHLNTLSFLMEFLKHVSEYEKQNKMGVENLAKVFVPSIMPLQETTMIAMQSRLEAQVIIIKILIENAEKIGVLPDSISESISAEFTGSTDIELDGTDSYMYSKYKKKKHRSGSLTRKPHLSASNLNLRMLSGLKKIVGKNNLPHETDTINEVECMEGVLNTPSYKAAKKRKVETTVESTYLIKNYLGEKSPLQKVKVTKNTSQKCNSEVITDKIDKSKKMRLSLDKLRKNKVSEADTEKCKIPESPCIERRWSSASSSCQTQKKHPIQRKDSASLGSLLNDHESSRSQIQKMYDDVFMDADVNLSDSSIEQFVINDLKRESESKSKRISMIPKRRSLNALLTERSMKRSMSKHKLESEMLCSHNIKRTKSTDSVLPNCSLHSETSDQSEEYVRIPKSEYEEIKNRVSAIESRISQEFGNFTNDRKLLVVDSVTNVQNEYEKTLEEASIENTMSADNLAKRMSKELKIRRSAEHRIFRSPSARKIGSIRKRSQERLPRRKVSRTASWHSTDRPNNPRTPLNIVKPTITYTRSIPVYNDSNDFTVQTGSSCSDETNARLDYLQEQLHTLISQTVEHTRSSLSDEDLNLEDEILISNKRSSKLSNSTLRRTSSFHVNDFDENSQYYDKKINDMKKTNSQQNIIDDKSIKEAEPEMWRNGGSYFATNSPHIRTPVPQTGRASVAKLRAQNAGMVLAKAKLFDETTVKMSQLSQQTHAERKFARNQGLQRKQSMKFQPKLKDIKNSDSTVMSEIKNKVGSSPKNNTSEKMRLPQTPNQACDRSTVNQRNSSNFEYPRSQDVKYKSASHQKENEDVKMHSYKNVQTNSVLQEANMNIYNHDVDGCRTPHIKKPLLLRTPRSAKLARRPAVEIKRTPMKAVPIVTPKRSSPAVKSKYMKQQVI